MKGSGGPWWGVSSGWAWSVLSHRLGLSVGGGVAFVLVVVLYVSLAGSFPGMALLASSIVGLLGVVLGVLAAWPVERKVTLQRQAEVVGYRLLLAIGVYVVVGVGALWGLNMVMEAQVPLDWPGGFARRVPFWPFYALVLVGCSFLLPTPPGAC